jgi:prophage regulatory protein
MRLPQVLTYIPVSKATMWRWVKAGTFPAPVKLSSNVTAWRVENVRRWMAEHAEFASVKESP